MSQSLVTDFISDLRDENIRLLNDLEKCQKLNELLLKYRICLINYLNVCKCDESVDKSSVQTLEEEYKRLTEPMSDRNTKKNESEVYNVSQEVEELNVKNHYLYESVVNEELNPSYYDLSEDNTSKTSTDTTPKRLDCELLGCDKTFSSKNSLCLHMNRYHKKGRLFQCLKCEDLFPDRSLLKRHQSVHQNSGSDETNSRRSGELLLNDSVADSSGGEGQTSPQRSLNTLISQISNQNNSTQVLDTRSDNSIESQVMSKNSLNEMYLNFVRKEIRTQVTECEHGKRLKRYFCTWTDCEHRANSNQDLLLHIRRRHTFEKPFRCDKCGKSFELQKVLTQHKRIHSDSKFECDFDGCPYRTPYEWDLKEHRNRKHFPKDRYDCHLNGCHKSYKYRADLKAHQKRDHQMC